MLKKAFMFRVMLEEMMVMMVVYSFKRILLIILIVLMAIILVMGYVVGDYFVDYALKRGNATDPQAPPAACEDIHDKSVVIPATPLFSAEIWKMDSRDGRHLVATYYMPQKKGHQWAIIVHGYGRDQRYVRDYAKEYLDKGWNVVTPDLCASGQSEGQYITMGVKESEEVVNWAAKIKEYDPQAEIVLHGVSMGAATVLLAAGKYDVPGLTAVVEDCGYTSAYEMFANQLGVIFALPEFPIMSCVDVVSGIKTGVKVSEAAPLQIMENIKVPVMFIHGEADKLVPISMMDKLYHSCHTKKIKFVVKKAGHGDSMTEAGEKYWQTVFSFLHDV